MKRDNGVTVTRDMRVTSQVRRHVTNGVTKRVSHATTTTPHRTMSLVSVSCGCGGSDQSQVAVSYALLGLEPIA